MTTATLAVLAAFGCAFLWSGFDALRKQLVAAVDPLPLTCLLALGQTPIYLAWAASEGLPPISAAYLVPGVAVWAINMAANLLFFASLRRAELSATVPLLSLTPVVASILAWLWLGESLSGQEIAGVVLVVAGALAMNLPLKAETSGDSDVSGVSAAESRAANRDRWVRTGLMALVATMWAATSIFDKVSMQSTSIAMHATVQSSALGASLLVWLALRGQLKSLAAVRSVRRSFVIGCLMAAAALALQLYAVSAAHVGLIEAIKRAIGAMSALALGWLFFGERFHKARVAAVSAMAVGVCLVAI